MPEPPRARAAPSTRARVPTPARRVSIILPARNEAAKLARALPGTLAQQTPQLEIEVLVADNGSTDGTAGIARELGARVVRVNAGARGGNPAAARNCAATLATGDPIAFLDADCVPADADRPFDGRRIAGRDPQPAPALARMWCNCWHGLVAYWPAARPRAGR